MHSASASSMAVSPKISSCVSFSSSRDVRLASALRNVSVSCSSVLAAPSVLAAAKLPVQTTFVKRSVM